MLNLMKACLLNMNYSVGDMLKQEDVDDIKELTYDISDYDYMDIGLINLDKNKLIYSIDNIHGHPDAYIEGYLKALDDNGIEYKLSKGVLDVSTIK